MVVKFFKKLFSSKQLIGFFIVFLIALALLSVLQFLSPFALGIGFALLALVLVFVFRNGVFFKSKSGETLYSSLITGFFFLVFISVFGLTLDSFFSIASFSAGSITGIDSGSISGSSELDLLFLVLPTILSLLSYLVLTKAKVIKPFEIGK